MKIHAFKVQARGATTFGQVVRHALSMTHEQRTRTVNFSRMRLEDARPTQNGSVYLDFGKIRHTGPGRAGKDKPIEDFDLEDGEGFGEESAAYYDSQTEYMILQYNHHGPRSRAIESYLFMLCRNLSGASEEALPEGTPDGFNVIPVMRPEQAERFNHMKIIKRIDAQVFVQGARSEGLESGAALSSILSNPLVASAKTLRIELTVPKTRGVSLSLPSARSFISSLLGVRDELTTLEVKGQEDETAPSEPIDLLEGRLQADIPIATAQSGRVPREARWQALKQAHDAWRDGRKLR